MIALLVAIVVMLWSPKGPEGPPGGAGPTTPAPPPVPSDRLEATAKPGKTYEIVLKGELTSKGFTREWGTEVAVYIQWLFECEMRRTIESNDGNTVVELRHYVAIRDVRLDAQVEDVRFDFGIAGQAVLASLEYVQPGSSTILRSLEPYATSIVGGAAQRRLDEIAKAKIAVDSLTGKSVRITYTNGVGITDIRPVDCELTTEERDFLRQTAVIADTYIMEDMNWEIGEQKTVDGRHLVGFIAPSLRGETSGSITLARKRDVTAGMHPAANLQVVGGELEIDSTTPEQYSIGTFVPRGTLVFDLEDQYVTSGDLAGEATIKNCSRDHILFETSLRMRPEMRVSYTCRMR